MHPRVTPKWFVIIVLIAFASLGPALALAQTPVAAPGAAPAGDPAGAEWMTYGGNLYNQRYSSLDQINKDNVQDLKGAWVYHTNIYSSGNLFRGLADRHRWRDVPDRAAESGLCRRCPERSGEMEIHARTSTSSAFRSAAARSTAVWPSAMDIVFVGQVDAKLTALNQETGEVAWSVQVDDPRAGYSETMAPVYYDGLVYIGVSGAEYEIRGHVTAYDAKTGDQVWRFYTIPGPGEFGHETWPQDNEMWKYGGGSMWQAPAIDPELGMLYIQVGNPSPDLDGTMRAGDNLFTESIVALDLKSGEYKWHFQEVHHDIWDYDTVSPNVLFDVEMDGQTVKGLGQAGKTGWVYLLNRETGEPLIGIEEKPVPQMEEQHTSPTQPFPVGDPFVPMECPEQVGNYPMGGIFTPFGSDPVLICPGANGGSEWSTVLVQPTDGADVRLRDPPAADLDVQAGQAGARHAAPGQRLHHAAGWQDLGHLHGDGRQDEHDRVAESARSDVHRWLHGHGRGTGLHR